MAGIGTGLPPPALEPEAVRPAVAPVAGSTRQRGSVPRPAGGNLESRSGPFRGCLPCAGCVLHLELRGRLPRS